MTVHVETLEKLERKITFTLPTAVIDGEVASRLRRMAREVKLDGFRPGKVPVNVIAQRYGYSVQYEVLNDKVSAAFADAAQQAQLRVAGAPKITENAAAPEGQLAFDAVFEVYPEVKLGALADLTVEKVVVEVGEAAIDRTLDILRKQRRTFAQREPAQVAQDGDRVSIDFEGKVDGESFEGGKADAFQFIVGDGQMLKEFEDAVRGMKVGESKTFPLAFPADYHGKEVAGKSADFMVTLNKIEAAELPAVDEALARALGIAEGTVEAMRTDVRKNLEREVKRRVQARNKQAALDALSAQAELDLPQSAVQAELDRLVEAARADLKQRGVPDAEKAPIPREMFLPQAERRVRLGLVVAELMRAHDLRARPEQVRAHVQELAASYEKPAEVLHWYTSDKARMAEVEGVVMENNVTDLILSQARVTEKVQSFDELMGSS